MPTGRDVSRMPCLLCLGCRACCVSDAVPCVSDAVGLCLGCRADVSRMPCLWTDFPAMRKAGCVSDAVPCPVQALLWVRLAAER